MVVLSLLFQQEYIKIAQQYFQLVGISASEIDTIPGRQCMASFFFLERKFKDVLLYLNSIKTYFSNVDIFNFNYAQAQAATGLYKEAEEAFLSIRNERYRRDFAYISLLAYCREYFHLILFYDSLTHMQDKILQYDFCNWFEFLKIVKCWTQYEQYSLTRKV